MKKENLFVILTGVVIGIAALVLTALGNPANMGFCIACFERDIAGAVGLHSAAKVQYVRPEIIGLVLGSFLMAIATLGAIALAIQRISFCSCRAVRVTSQKRVKLIAMTRQSSKKPWRAYSATVKLSGSVRVNAPNR